MTHQPTTATIASQANGRAAQSPRQSTALQQVSVVVPIYNERECVEDLIHVLEELEAEQGHVFDFEFVLVDDGSNDGTTTILRQAVDFRDHLRVVAHAENRGIAAAIHTGIVNSQSEIVVSMDADNSYDIKLIQELVPLMTDEVDLVAASPYHPLGKVDNIPLWRLWLSQRVSNIYRLLFRTKLHCYTGCFRVYRRSSVIDHTPQNRGYVGVAELLWRVDHAGGTIIEHPAVLRKRIAGTSKMRVIREGLKHLKLMAFILKNKFQSNSEDSHQKTGQLQ